MDVRQPGEEFARSVIAQGDDNDYEESGGLAGLAIQPATLNLLAVVRPLPAESK